MGGDVISVTFAENEFPDWEVGEEPQRIDVRGRPELMR